MGIEGPNSEALSREGPHRAKETASQGTSKGVVRVRLSGRGRGGTREEVGPGEGSLRIPGSNGSHFSAKPTVVTRSLLLWSRQSLA